MLSLDMLFNSIEILSGSCEKATKEPMYFSEELYLKNIYIKNK